MNGYKEGEKLGASQKAFFLKGIRSEKARDIGRKGDSICLLASTSCSCALVLGW